MINCSRSLSVNLHKYISSDCITRLLSSFSQQKSGRLVQELPINSYLKQNLIKNHIYELKQFQYQALMKSKNEESVFINSCTGSGKTLSYLIPILDRLFTKIEENKSKKGKNQNRVRDPIHGAVILTLNKQLCLQIYRSIRLLDPLNLLETKRTGPITHYIPVITQLNNNPKTDQQADIIDGKITQNLINTIKWSKTDILISTPQLLYNVMGMGQNRNKQKKDNICTQNIVIDEADLLLEIDKNVSGHSYKIIHQIDKNNKIVQNSKINSSKLTFFISTSSFPKKMDKIDYSEALQKRFPTIVEISGQHQHQIPKQIQLFFIEISTMQNKNKLSYVEDILRLRRNQRIIIFCNTKKSIDQISDFLKTSTILNSEQEKKYLQFDVYHASLDSNQRSRALHNFQSGKCSILISTDLGSRGLDFNVPVDLIIQFEMAENITGFLNRVGRTGRNHIKGEVITMVMPQNQQLFKHIEQLVGNNEKLDSAFSRKRSYNKLYKQK